jgi:hypothetical protein
MEKKTIHRKIGFGRLWMNATHEQNAANRGEENPCIPPFERGAVRPPAVTDHDLMQHENSVKKFAITNNVLPK